MKNIKVLKKNASFLVIFFCSYLSAMSQSQINWDEWDVIPGQIIISFYAEYGERMRLNPDLGIVGLSLELMEASVEEQFRRENPDKEFKYLLPYTFIGTFPPPKRDEIITKLSSNAEIEYFEPLRKRNFRLNWWGTSTPNDYSPYTLWGMERIGAPAAWEKQSSSVANIRVAIHEPIGTTGTSNIQINHPDLVNQDAGVHNNPTGSDNHATHVAGTVAATGNNGQGVVGVANVKLVSINVTSLVNDLSWAINNNIKIMNMSWGAKSDPSNCGGSKCCYPWGSNAEQNAINNAVWNYNMVLVAAAGNDTCDFDVHGRAPIPASYQNVIAVSALDTYDELASFSNYGPYIDLTAPGVSIYSTVVNDYDYYQGTSMASPHVAGSAAAVLAVKPSFNGRSIERLLKLTAEDIGTSGTDPKFGAGVVRVDRAVEAIADKYVEKASPYAELGTLYQPYFLLATAVNNISNNQVIGVVKGTSNETITINKPCTIISVGGIATIGKQ